MGERGTNEETKLGRVKRARTGMEDFVCSSRMGLKMFRVLLACVWVVAGSPLHPFPLVPHKGITRGSYIRHYSAAWYDTTALREHRARKRRDASVLGFRRETTLNLRLHALDRVFKMRLTRDTHLFSEDVVFEGSTGRLVPFDTSHVYTGTLEDDENASVHGVVTENGLFDGAVVTGSEEIYIEPASRYSNLYEDVPYHTIAYRAKDVATPPQERLCPSQRSRQNGSLDLSHTINKTGKDYHLDFSHPVYQHLSDEGTHAKPGFYPKDARKKDPTANSHDLKLLDKLYRERYSQALRKRTSIYSNKTTCMLYLQADHTFLKHYKSEEACIEVITRHVQRVNSIYRYTDFNQDGQPDNISFMIKRVKVHGEEALRDSTYRFRGTYCVEEFLELFSEENYDAFCLSYMFTYRDFEKGTLGLAWTGDLKNAGGVCEKNGHYRGSMKSLNTGIITLLNYGKHVPPAISHVTLAHEIGHNFGSPHDPDECSPGGEDGNFIMFARATSGDKRNNNRFSPCSLLSINPVLNAKARSAKGCFAEPQSAICGNGVVEEGEECDCGWEEDCNDPCCHPQRLRHAPHEVPCRLAKGAICSPSQGPCCTSGCTLRNGDKCRDDNGCRDASFCNGRGPHCPPSINKPNKTICNEEFVCYMGECTGSICLAYGLESCQCIAGPNDPATKSCELCCKLPGENQPCLSSFAWNSAPYDIPDMLSKPGTPCNDYNGYCDVFQRCREVDPSGPLATLRRLLLSDASLATFQRWMTHRWYAVALMILAVSTVLVVLTHVLGRRPGSRLKIPTVVEDPSSNVKKSSGKDESATKGRRSIASRMKLTHIKERIVETMKTITSPRRKKDPSFSNSRASSFLYFTSNKKRLLQGLRSGPCSKENAESSGEAKYAGERKEERNREPSGMKNVRGKYADETSISDNLKNEFERKDESDAKRTFFLDSNERDMSGREEKDGWLMGFARNFASGKSSPVRKKLVSSKTSWVNGKLRRVEKFCSSPTLISSQNQSESNQSEPLVIPDTPETPSDLPELRILTSDLTVLLQES